MTNAPNGGSGSISENDDAVRNLKSSESVVAAFHAEGFPSPPGDITAIITAHVKSSTRDIPLNKIANMAPGSGPLGTSAAAGVNMFLTMLTPAQREAAKAGVNPLDPAAVLKFSMTLNNRASGLEAGLAGNNGGRFSGMRDGLGDRKDMGAALSQQASFWHYKDIPFSPDSTATKDGPEPNAETQIIAFRDTLASQTASDKLKSYDLVWLLHLVGDVHQPLHATTRYTQDLPDGDRGGNSVLLCESPCRNELHAFWDNLLGTGTSTRAAINAARKVDDAPAGSASNQDIPLWVVESFEIAKASAYKSPIGPNHGPFTLTDPYKRAAKKIANERIAIAGARLTKLINDNLR
jgi:S1/P1 Nuclease